MFFKYTTLIRLSIAMGVNRSQCSEVFCREAFQVGFPSVTCMPNAACSVKLSIDCGRCRCLKITSPCKGPSIIAVNRKFTHTRLAANRKLCFRFRRLSVIIVGHLVFGLDIPPTGSTQRCTQSWGRENVVFLPQAHKRGNLRQTYRKGSLAGNSRNTRPSGIPQRRNSHSNNWRLSQ